MVWIDICKLVFYQLTFHCCLQFILSQTSSAVTYILLLISCIITNFFLPLLPFPFLYAIRNVQDCDCASCFLLFIPNFLIFHFFNSFYFLKFSPHLYLSLNPTTLTVFYISHIYPISHISHKIHT